METLWLSRSSLLKRCTLISAIPLGSAFLEEIDVQFYEADIKVGCFSKYFGRKKARPTPSTLDESVSVTLTCTVCVLSSRRTLIRFELGLFISPVLNSHIFCLLPKDS